MKKTCRRKGLTVCRTAVAAIWAAVLCVPGFAEGSRGEEPSQAWRAGPVQYILSSEESGRYKHLSSDEERAGFIKDFWARRDPTAGTPENEFRSGFWKRVEEANATFKEGSREGWETDRGRILLAAGYPDERCGEGSPVEGWLYRRSFPSRFFGVKDPNTKIIHLFSAAFARKGSGKYKAAPYRDLSDGKNLLEAVHSLTPDEAVAYAMGAASMPPSHVGHDNPGHLAVDALQKEFFQGK